MDLVVRCAHLPVPGETVSALSLNEVPGGKGANQAVAAARAGGNVHMIGCVGQDGFGTQLIENLRGESVGCDSVAMIDGCESGIAIVNVEDSGENSIIVVPGANGRLTGEAIMSAETTIAGSDVLMVQLETPVESVLAGIRFARRAGVKVILDPAPAIELPDAMFDVDLICPNESEAMSIVGGTLESIEDAEAIARRLFERGPRAVAITLGARGTMLFDGSDAQLIPSIPISVVDTTAAGDAFAGALAVRWAETGSLAQAVRWANVAGAIAASSLGAQPSLPTREQIDAMVAQCE